MIARQKVLRSERIDKGRPFQIEEPATAKHMVEDLVQLNGGSGSTGHLVWGYRAQQDRPEQGPANSAIPMKPSYIQFAA